MRRIFHSFIFKFIIITLLFFIVTSPVVVLFGPFGNLKRAVVGAIMRSRHPQYITWLYSQDELNQILGVVKTTDTQKVFSFKPRTDSTLNLKKIETSRFVGYLLEIPNPTRVEVATAEDINEKGTPPAALPRRTMRWQPLTAAVSMTQTAPAPAVFPTDLSSIRASTFWDSRWMTRKRWIL